MRTACGSLTAQSIRRDLLRVRRDHLHQKGVVSESFPQMLDIKTAISGRGLEKIRAPGMKQFWSITRKRTQSNLPLTHLTQAHRRKAKGITSTPIAPIAPRPETLCRGCGKSINASRQHCARCAVDDATKNMLNAAQIGRQT